MFPRYKPTHAFAPVHTMPDVTHIPTELWHDIIALACVDGGLTGRSLALASRFFYAQSLYGRFHSLAFNSLQQLEGFLAFLRLQSVDYRPKIRHICLSFLDEPVKTSLVSMKVHSGVAREQQRAHDFKTQEERARWDGRFCVASIALLTLAARTLHTLCVVEDGLAPLPLTFPCELPQLRELSWRGKILAFEPSALGLTGTSRFTATFPALERVHFITTAVDGIVPMILLTKIPTITHFRISNVGYVDILLPDALARALGVKPMYPWLADGPEDGNADPQQSSVSSLSTPRPHLRQLIIQGTSSAPGGWCWHYNREWARIHSQLEALAHGPGLDGTRTLVLDRPWFRALRWPHRMRDYWLDRIQGGRGCWVESEAQEVVSEGQ